MGFFCALARLSMGAKIYYLYVQLPSNGPKHNSQTNGQLKNTSNYVCLWPRGFACTHRHRAHSITAACCCNTGHAHRIESGHMYRFSGPSWIWRRVPICSDRSIIDLAHVANLRNVGCVPFRVASVSSVPAIIPVYRRSTLATTMHAPETVNYFLG